MNEIFDYAKPEEVGIRSEAIKSFLEELKDEQICMNSMMIIRHGKIVAETYYKPFYENSMHRMYSVTKTFVGIAIGFLADDKKIRLDDNIVDYFPDKLPIEGTHPFIKKITIRNMLCMSTAHENTTFKHAVGNDWVGSYFNTMPTHLPGTFFSYESSATCVLTAMIENMTGKTLLDYLREKFLNEIGFSEDAYILKTPDHYSHGASGLVCTPMDIAKVAWILMHHGKLNDKQYIPQWYVDEATVKQVDNNIKGITIEEQQGYGYQIWMTRNNGFALYGMGGQLALCLPEKDLLLVTTADTLEYPEGMQRIYDAFWRTIFFHIQDEPCVPTANGNSQLEKYLNSRAMEAEAGMYHSKFQERVNKNTYTFLENKLNIDKIIIAFQGDEGSIVFTRNEQLFNVQFGFGKMISGVFLIYNKKYLASAAWKTDQQLFIKMRVIDPELIGTVDFQITLSANGLTLFIKSFGDVSAWQLSGAASSQM